MVSIFAKIMMKMLEKNKHFPFEMEKVDEVRDNFEKMTSKAKPAKGINLEEIQIGNIPAEIYTYKKDYGYYNGLTLLYLHGGGYFLGSYATHRSFVSALCKKLHLQTAYSINYQLAPENPYPAAIDDAFFVYKWLLEERTIQARNIIIAGDSAGGGLTLALLNRIKSRGLSLPKAAITLSAWTDLTFSSKTLVTKAEEDPFFSVKNIKAGAMAYLGNSNPKNPEISPLFGDFEGFPPVFLQVGSREVLLGDTLNIAEKMKQQGVSVTMDVQEGMFHAFLIFYSMFPKFLMPELKLAMNNVVRFVENL